MDDIYIPMINGNLSDLDQTNDDQNETPAVLARESLYVLAKNCTWIKVV